MAARALKKKATSNHLNQAAEAKVVSESPYTDTSRPATDKEASSEENWNPNIFADGELEEEQFTDDEPSSEFGLHAFEAEECLRRSRELSPEELARLQAKAIRRKRLLTATYFATGTVVALLTALLLPFWPLRLGALTLAGLLCGLGVWYAWPRRILPAETEDFPQSDE